MARPIGQLGVIPTLQVGNWVFTDLTTLIVLHGAANTNAHWTTLRKSNASAGYQITSGKTYTVNAVSMVTGAVGSSTTYFGYGDNDVGLNNASAPTNFVYIAGDSSLGGMILPEGAPVGTIVSQNCAVPIPQLKYVGMGINSAAIKSLTTFGYEA